MKQIIIMPTYNEAENIKKIIPILFNQMDISILVVDDNSPDGTANIVEEYQKKYSNLYLLKREQKDGLASAYIAGFKYALDKNYQVLAQMDSDFQHPYEVLPEMLKKLEQENADILIGSRYVQNGKWEKGSLKKEIISKLGNIYSRIVLNSKVNDLTGGYNIWTKKALLEIGLDNIIAKGYMFQIEMKFLAEKNNLKIIEYPIKFSPRIEGQSKMDFKICIEALTKIWKLRKK